MRYEWDFEAGRRRTNLFFAGLAAVLLVVAALLIWASIEEEKEWQAFAEKHHCKVIGRQEARHSTRLGVSHTGAVVVIPMHDPARVGYACDDGVIYWR